MTATPLSYPEFPANFAERSQRIFDRLQSGEKMTVQYLADQLGLPFEFVATAMAISIAARDGCQVIVDCSPAKPLN